MTASFEMVGGGGGGGEGQIYITKMCQRPHHQPIVVHGVVFRFNQEHSSNKTISHRCKC